MEGNVDVNADGVADATQIIPNGEVETKDETVAYKTYKKAMDTVGKKGEENKTLKAELAEYKLREEAAETKRLESEGEYKKIAEIERSKREELEAKNKDYEKNLVDAHKLNAFREALSGEVASPEYYDFVNLDDIAINPETGLVDEMSVKQTADTFMEKHWRLLSTDKKSLPNNAPQGDKGRLSNEEWRKLPLKERKARMSEVYKSNNN